MSVTVPSTPSLIELNELVSTRPGLASTWEDMLQLQNYVVAHTGARVPGHYYSSAATTTSSTLTQANSTVDQPDLDVWFPCSRLAKRCLISSTDSLSYELQIFATQCEARLSIIRLDTGATAATLDVTQSGGSSAWASGSGGITYASGLEDVLLAYKLEFKATAGTASLYAWAVHEKHLDAADLPDGT